MASRKITVQGVVIVLVAMLWAPTTIAQSDCTSVLITMAPCLNYVTGSSPNPSASCCSQLANVVQSQPRCLCTALNGGGASLGVSINSTLALALPALCNVKTPPVSKCNGDGNGTALSPAGSPQGDDIPASSGGSKTVSATSNGVKMTVKLILFVLPTFYVSTSLNF
ncbi:glycosylphosphatidylinositol-anchored lipid protein transfer 5 [Hibiscus trionum]|uniref:Glycosylphosphatidylinositol-anchored lipid protein transfer 5 n=1 Tax=Hibiscus trionum TaxID=183268 RepID=A0A9W7I4W9_HIBTR|nr:glycosylphosphatidylinositol-anchored lipid protein transfer 5 [Hibiscus trionum]